MNPLRNAQVCRILIAMLQQQGRAATASPAEFVADLEEFDARAESPIVSPVATRPVSQGAAPQSVISALRYEIGQARETMARLLDPTQEGRGKIIPPDWHALHGKALAALAYARQDTRVVACVMEAAAQCDGFAGIAAGARLAADLLDAHFETLDPRPEPDMLSGDAARDATATMRAILGPLAGLLADELPAVARCQTLFMILPDTPYSYDSYRREQVRSGIKKSPDVSEHIDALNVASASIGEALAAVSQLSEAIKRRNGNGIVSTTNLAEVLGEIDKVIKRLVPAAAAQPAAAAADAQDASKPAAPVAAGWDRQRSVAALLDIAAAFRRGEPQSPIGEVLEEVARRAQLSWTEIAAEMLPDKNLREAMRIRLGLPATPREAAGR